MEIKINNIQVRTFDRKGMWGDKRSTNIQIFQKLPTGRYEFMYIDLTDVDDLISALIEAKNDLKQNP